MLCLLWPPRIMNQSCLPQFNILDILALRRRMSFRCLGFPVQVRSLFPHSILLYFLSFILVLWPLAWITFNQQCVSLIFIRKRAFIDLGSTFMKSSIAFSPNNPNSHVLCLFRKSMWEREFEICNKSVLFIRQDGENEGPLNELSKPVRMDGSD